MGNTAAMFTMETDVVAGRGTGSSRLPLLLQLVSPTLPVGAYAYSQGLEQAVEWGWISDERSAHDWITGVLLSSLMTLDVPVLQRLALAWEQSDYAALCRWNAFLLACRETSELRAEDRNLGQALRRLLPALDVQGLAELQREHATLTPCYALGFTCVGSHWQIDIRTLATGYCWSWVENQVMAALKLMSLGQTAGQRMLLSLGRLIDEHIDAALALPDAHITGSLPGFAIASAAHETQFSRLFRS